MGPYKIATIEPFYNYKVNSFVRKYIDCMCRLAGLSTFTNSTFHQLYRTGEKRVIPRHILSKVLKYKHKRENLQVPRPEKKKKELPTKVQNQSTSTPLQHSIPETTEQLGDIFPHVRFT